MALLWEAGTQGIEVLSAFPGEVTLLAYFPDAPDVGESLRSRLAGLAPIRIEPVAVPEVDWVARFREGFRPFACGGFWIAPVWDVPRQGPEGQSVLVVDPGRAFGTGTHETTRLCLTALETLSPFAAPESRVLDIGTGTGLLAVAALRLGWRRVVGIEIDPEAVASARAHARLNRVDLAVVQGDGGGPFAAGSFAVVVANITAPLLLERCDEIGRLAEPGGFLVLSGMLVTDVEPVREAYGRFGDVRTALDGQWASLCTRVSG